MQQLVEIVMDDRRMAGDDFRGRVARAASGFQSAGIRTGDFIAVLMRNEPAMLEAIAAAQHLGAYAVPFNWHSKAGENIYVLHDCKARILVVHADLLAEVRSQLPAELLVIGVDTPANLAQSYRVPQHLCSTPAGVLRWEDFLAAHDPIRTPARPALDSVFYTSGTSGRPKGVRRLPPTSDQLRHAGEIRELMYGSMGGDSHALLAAPLYHGGPNVFGIRAMRQARSLILPARFDAEALLADIERHRVTHLYAVATMFVRLLALPDAVRSRHDLSSLKSVIHGGSPCSPAIKRRMIDWWGPVINEYYGSTETGPTTLATSAEWLAHEGTAGRPLPGVRLEIRGEDGALLPTGEPGEVWSSHPDYPDFTYLNLPEQRAALQRGEFVATGDMGYLDADGFLYLCDRKKDMVISGGVNIYPAEIEAVLMQMDGVADCAVFGIPDPEFGESLAAHVQPRPGATLDAAAIEDFLGREIARFKVPRTIKVCESLPREESGKIKKRLLREPYWVGTGRSI